ncbi:MAG: hypothetical protein WCX46_01165 [Candidatus Paceibacterota bacterium]
MTLENYLKEETIEKLNDLHQKLDENKKKEKNQLGNKKSKKNKEEKYKPSEELIKYIKNKELEQKKDPKNIEFYKKFVKNTIGDTKKPQLPKSILLRKQREIFKKSEELIEEPKIEMPKKNEQINTEPEKTKKRLSDQDKIIFNNPKTSDKNVQFNKDKNPENRIVFPFKKIVEILKNKKINQIVIHAKEQNEPGLDKALTFENDVDTQLALDMFNNYNTRGIDNIYAKNAVTSLMPKGGSEKNLTEKREGVVIYLDVSGNNLKIEENGKTTTIYIDHHGPGKKTPTSASELMYELMDAGKILKPKNEWLKKMSDFVTNMDNLSYLENIKKGGDKNFFENEWTKTLCGLFDKIPYKTLKTLFQTNGEIVNPSIEKQIKNPLLPFTKEQINGEFGQIEIEVEEKNKETGKKEKVKRTISTIFYQNIGWKGEVKNTIKGIKKLTELAEKQGLNLNDTVLGKVVYQKIYKKEEEKNKNIFIPHSHGLAFTGAKYLGYDTFASWDEKNNKFHINSNHPNLSAMVNKLNEVDPGCATDVRGVMVFGKIKGLTEKRFLEIIQGRDDLKTSKPEKVSATNKETEEERKKQEKIKENEAKIQEIEKQISLLMRKMPHQKIEGVPFSELNFDDLDFYEERFKAEQKRSEPFSQKVSDFWKNKLVELGKIKNLLVEREGLQVAPKNTKEKPKALKPKENKTKTTKTPKSSKKTLPEDVLSNS